MELFASYLCLVYHEARNVRHLIRAGCLPVGPYERMRSSLPTNRNAAWEAMQDIRLEASQSCSATAASELLASRYGIDLQELVLMFEHECWTHSAYGGNRWAGITGVVLQLRDALDQSDTARTQDLLGRVDAMSHNTDGVDEKLRDLDAALRGELMKNGE